MRKRAPFQIADLRELDERVLSKADAVVALREVHAGNRDPGVIQMRHDVDNASGAFECACKLADWEAKRGYRSTYFLLHTARYWPDIMPSAMGIALQGHEIGLHLDAVGEWARTGENPHDILVRALAELRDFVSVRGVVGHGNHDLDKHGLTNDSMILEFARERGTVDKYTRATGHAPRPLADYGFDYEGVLLGRGFQMTDSSGGWNEPFDKTVARFETRLAGQMHFNMHPDWWIDAFRD